jgi:cytochrome c553
MKIRMALLSMFVLLLAAGTAQAGGDAANGKVLSEDCASCHGGDGVGDDETPALTGIEEAAFIAALKGYASGEIEDESGMMADYATDLSEQDMADLAAYYASLQ